ncbi:hypothetical protein EJ05DRAFT_371518 [Pseudovirgaria hyperparasitica]|uniref:Uncharacterized protein n=1 Tax=Pseudovirgaria hyperparasitica TaxID=470096 RepID=A0A6A6W7P6_9PEZI|nr:uncharacterized protein EJ05DRAFT_371518 [Pseudovirgaria hyperparasitica]KAF2757906.1 hypothetical protein EJ05DRAFT_371518 [Pseudovirgaria hyperparasitica]
MLHQTSTESSCSHRQHSRCALLTSLCLTTPAHSSRSGHDSVLRLLHIVVSPRYLVIPTTLATSLISADSYLFFFITFFRAGLCVFRTGYEKLYSSHHSFRFFCERHSLLSNAFLQYRTRLISVLGSKR